MNVLRYNNINYHWHNYGITRGSPSHHLKHVYDYKMIIFMIMIQVLSCYLALFFFFFVILKLKIELKYFFKNVDNISIYLIIQYSTDYF